MTEKACGCKDPTGATGAMNTTRSGDMPERRPSNLSTAARSMLQRAVVPNGFKAGLDSLPPAAIRPAETTLPPAAPGMESWSGARPKLWADDWVTDAGPNRDPDPPTEPLRLSDMRIDLEWAPHAPETLRTAERYPIAGLVGNTYATFWGGDGFQMQMDPCEQGGEDGGEPDPEPVSDDDGCVKCRLIVLYGQGKRVVNKWEGQVTEDANRTLSVAHKAAETYYKSHKQSGTCLQMVHFNWTGEDRHVIYDEKKNDWARKSGYKLKNMLTRDLKERRIHCFSEVLVLYHGGEPGNTKEVLSLIDRYTEGSKSSSPIETLYLWSCYGSQNIDFKDPVLTEFIQTMGKRREAIIEETGSETCCRPLCIYTAADLDKKKAIKKLDKLTDNRIKKRRLVYELAKKIVKNSKPSEQFAVPLGIEGPKGKKKSYELLLYAPFRMLRRYCVETGKEEKAKAYETIFTDVTVKHGNCHLMHAVLRKLGNQKKEKLRAINCY